MDEMQVRVLLHDTIENIIARIGQYPMRGDGAMNAGDLVAALIDASKDVLGFVEEARDAD